jgi:hypothetical protein
MRSSGQGATAVTVRPPTSICRTTALLCQPAGRVAVFSSTPSICVRWNGEPLPNKASICSDASGDSSGCFFFSCVSQSLALPGYASISRELRIRGGASGHAKRIPWLPMIKILSVLNSLLAPDLPKYGLDETPTSSCRRPRLTVPACTARSASSNSFCSPPDPPPQSLASKIHAFGRHERRRQPQTLHTLIAAGEKGTKFTGREAKQLFPVRNKGSIWKMD